MLRLATLGVHQDALGNVAGLLHALGQVPGKQAQRELPSFNLLAFTVERLRMKRRSDSLGFEPIELIRSQAPAAIADRAHSKFEELSVNLFGTAAFAPAGLAVGGIRHVLDPGGM